MRAVVQASRVAGQTAESPDAWPIPATTAGHSLVQHEDRRT